MKLNFILRLFCLFIVTLSSCSEKETDPTPDPTNQPVEESQLVGKWEVVAVLFKNYDKDGKVENSGGNQKGGANWQDSFVTYMTFNPDKTYTHNNASGSNQGGIILQDTFPQKGQWGLNDDNKLIQITTYSGQNSFPEWQVLEFSAKKMKITYTEQAASGKKYEQTIEMVK